MSSTLVPGTLSPLPPAAKLVYCTLSRCGPQRSTEIAERTRLPPSTVQTSLTRLQETDAVETRPCVEDARAREYLTALESE